ncbi:MAG: redox-regulated ATPase YchF [alpha proteobacterium HIMB59]|jgi:GTP-binding protein YchF|nr:MAG: redox-regulated ATPase YchF [alpha proteobacterium HIMB59]|tara:strand:- start:774 stop:1859 length:1086 start_codon:yes stop_codon:yes gene_type:complete
MKCGIIGLPNVGKSTLFNALCENEQALAANYPFATIDPNSSLVKVPDERLDQIANICNPQKIIPAAFEIVDIAGLVKGASKGEGLGNAFLSHIRSVNALFHIVRCFEDDDIQHVENRIDPLSDIQIINAELALSDLDILEKNHQKLKKMQKTDDDKKKVSIIEKAIQLISDEKKILGNLDKEEINYLNTYQLISTKPVVYICNVDENSALSGNEFTKKIDTYSKENNSEVLLISAKIESEISQITDFKDKQDFLESMGLKETGLKRVIKKGYEILNYINYFTAGEKELRAWTITKGTLAPSAAGTIHSDMEKGFIRAETISFNDYLSHKGEAGAKEKGKLRLEGKEYEVKDGDIMHFLFNV